MKYKRVLLKLSGEALKNKKDAIIDFEYVKEICLKIKNAHNLGYEFGIVSGGGNVWRGRNTSCISIEEADIIGLLGTTINAVAISAVFNSIGSKSQVVNAFDIENLINKNASNINELLKQNIIVFGGGTGKGGCSTDTAAALRAVEMNTDAIVKITNVDGLYDKDPNKYENAIMYNEVSFDEVIDKKLQVMDLESIKICKENKIPIIITNMNRLDQLDKILSGNIIGSIVKD